ncbi:MULTISPECIES: GDSL-type esterase/lipase family protein [unclassified Microbulbifer]|uniref:rhamnogalacturonan lyase family protein n=1 Tax=unclassified Microbulbifer TaxID=2619833 RepID=UPI0027E57B1C|nr:MULTISPECIES: GDSL-type esterase/lipase family protein [unclassified Microbulbifer]
MNLLLIFCLFFSLSVIIHEQAYASSGFRQMEYLDRGLVAVKVDTGVFVSWRLLGTEPEDITFDLYRDGTKVNSLPITSSTNYLDPNGTIQSRYHVRAVFLGKEQIQSKAVGVWEANYLDVPLNQPPAGANSTLEPYIYNANDASIGDLDGDGEYEIVLKWDPSNSHDNAPSPTGSTGEVFIDAYELDGTQMWRISLGKNIRAGAHYTQFMVYDLDGDGKSEIAFRTADGTVDGAGKVIGDPDADYRDSEGMILQGSEFLTVFEGETGKALVTTEFSPPRGNVCDWGDCYGNRVDRFLAAIAYLDGERPSLIMTRGYYAKTMLSAYNYRDGQLTKLWTFNSEDPGNEGYGGQGNHNISIADVDGDGKDEITFGAMAIDDDGAGLYTTGLGHGDAMHLGDLDPDRPGLEVFDVHEHADSPYGAEFRDARTGEIIWGVYTGKDTGRGMSADIDPRYRGEEVWSSTGVGLWTNKGTKISSTIPSSINFGIWWDADLLRELANHNLITNGFGTIDKWDYKNESTVNLLTAIGTSSNNTTKGTPNLQADLLGDWREEIVWRTADNSALRIFTSTDVTEHRIHTLMHDPVYRLGIAWQNVSYNQPPHPSFYLGVGMDTPPRPDIYTYNNSTKAYTPAIYKFDFGNGSVESGYSGVSASDPYSPFVGYGFQSPEFMKDVAASGTGAASDAVEFLKSSTDSGRNTFNVDLKNGLYHVAVTLGDTVRSCVSAEGVYQIMNMTGNGVSDSFLIPVNDGQLNININTAPNEAELTLSALKITKISNKPAMPATIWIGGDSTVANYYPKDSDELVGWGQVMPQFVDPDTFIVRNMATAGQVAKGFLEDGQLDAILEYIKPGDYFLFEMGINDTKRYSEEEFVIYMRAVIEAVKAKGAQIVLVAPQGRSISWKTEGVDLVHYAEEDHYRHATIALANEQGVDLVDLNVLSSAYFTEVGPVETATYYKTGDWLHFNRKGAMLLADIVVQDMKRQGMKGFVE